MKKNCLPYFKIEKSFGGDQRWFRNPLMYFGGCAAATACDSLIAMGLLPKEKEILTKGDYRHFVSKMRPYLYPRKTGVDTPNLFIEGLSEFLQDVKCNKLFMEPFYGEESLAHAAGAVIRQIDRGLPIPYLLLKHKDPNLNYLTWHWFIVLGYEKTDQNDLWVDIATYGKHHRENLTKLWDTGYEEKGGMILYHRGSVSSID